MNAIDWLMTKDTIKIAPNYRKEVNGNELRIYDDISDRLIFIIDREQKTFSLEMDLAKRRKRNWYQYFEKNNYKRIKGEFDERFND